MKNRLYICLLTISVITLFYGCRDRSFHKRADYQEVMKYHDEAMIEMGVIHNLGKKLKKIDLSSTPDNSQIEKMIVDLENADEGMMAWMAQFKAHNHKEELDTYLADQLVKVKKVHTDIFNSINAAKKYLNEE